MSYNFSIADWKKNHLPSLLKESQLSETEGIKVGTTYVYEHPKAGPVKVKALGASSYGDDYFTVESLEDKGEVKKGNQYNVEIKNLTLSQNESYLNEAEEIKVGGTYTYNWKEGKTPIKVKVLAQDKDEPDFYIVESLEDTQDGIKKGNHYRAEAKNLKA